MDKAILIIEDNTDNQYLMQYLLEKHGYRVVWAKDGKTGIDYANQNRPLAILLDIQLPEMNGYEVAEVLTRNDRLQGVPIIAVTSYAMVGDREKALASGATAYMEKPINPATFVSEIAAYINDSKPE